MDVVIENFNLRNNIMMRITYELYKLWTESKV